MKKKHGTVPKGMIVTFKDGNKQNCSIENLLLMSRAEAAVMTHFKLRGTTPELMETGVLVSKIILQKSKLKKKQKK
ncbi:HNH endonuclease signature motif containing protein [Treponema denticola]|uniref:HNH endonuclease signature motif containing protein n=1 Tax=Treponema denticola TaxID=158 RepID=UPI003D8BD2B3